MKLFIIQISDLHLEKISSLDKLGIEVVEAKSIKIFDCFKGRISNLSRTKIIIALSGDLANSGISEEYDTIIYFIDSLISRIKDEYPEVNVDIVIVPGNHDVDFSEANEGGFGNQKAYIEFLSEVERLTLNYVSCSLISDYGKTFSIHQNNSIGRVRYILINSSKKSTKCEKQGHISIDTSSTKTIEIENISKDYGECDVSLAIMHHPHEWFSWDKKNDVKRFIEQNADIVILGHEHNSDSYEKKNYDRSSNFYLHGAVFSDSKDRESSYFNILELDLSTMTEKYDVFEWSSLKNSYTEMVGKGTNGYRIFERNRFMSSTIDKCNDQFNLWLEESDGTIKTIHGSTPNLNEVFVFPDITLTHNLDERSFRKSSKIIPKKHFIEEILEHKKIYLYSMKGYGKTATTKSIYKELLNRKLYPLYLTSLEMNSAHNKDLPDFFQKKYKEQYEDPQLIYRKRKDEKIIIVEFSDMTTFYSNKYVEIFSSFIDTQFDYIIYTFDEHTYSFSLPKKFIAYLRATFVGYKIHKIGSRVKNDLIERFFELSFSKENELSEVEWDIQFEEFSKRVNYVFKHQLIDETPLRILQVSSVLITNVNQERFNGKYSFLYNMLIDRELSRIEVKKRNKYKAIIEFIAFRIYYNCEDDFIFDDSCIPNALLDYERFTKLKRPDAIEVFNDLNESGIIEKVGENNYKMKLNYMIYFFIATYISKRINSDKISVIESII